MLNDKLKFNESLIEDLELEQSKPIKYISLCGGGVKGYSYVGVYRALKELNIMKDIEIIAGNSIGAIMGAYMAFGISEDKLYEITKNLDLVGMLKSEGKIFTAYDVKNLYIFFDKILNETLKEYLDSKDENELAENYMNSFEEKGLCKSKILNVVKNLKDKSNSNKEITFKDLDILRKIDPIRFKKLILAAVNNTNLNLELFDYKQQDVKITDPVRASMAIVGIFSAHKIKNIPYIDGGYADNMLLGFFHDLNWKDIGRPLLYGFDIEDRFQAVNTMKPINPFYIFLQWILPTKLSFYFTITDIINTYNELKEYSINSIIINQREITTISFERATKTFTRQESEGYVKTMKYLYNHGYLSKKFKNDDKGLSECINKLEFQAFILELYDELSKDNGYFSWISSFFCSKADRYKYVADFASKEYWQTKNSDQVLDEFIKLISLKKDSKGSLKVDDKVLKISLEKLSRPDTAQKLKEKFIKKLGINIDTSSNEIETDIMQYKFKAQDLYDYLDPYNLKDVELNGITKDNEEVILN